MKQLLVLVTILFVSCKSGISEDEQSNIRMRILVHNSNLMFTHYDSSDTQHYYPNSDPNLTYEKLIKYCNKKGFDPIVFSKLLTTK